MPTTKTKKHIFGLDFLRALAVVLVVLFHYLPEKFPGGFIGVDIFFVVSGFIITYLLLNEYQRRGGIALKKFWIRRARRLLPALAVVLVTVTALLGLMGGDLLVGIFGQVFYSGFFVANWLFISKDATYADYLTADIFQNTWSLGVEEQFYLLWPLILVVVLHFKNWRRVLLWVISMIAFISMLLMVLYSLRAGQVSRVYMGTDTRVFTLMFGALVAVLVLNRIPGSSLALSHAQIRATRAVRVLLLSCAAFFVFLFAMGVHFEDRFVFRPGLILLALVIACLIGYFLLNQDFAQKLDLPWVVWVARRSYAFYLWHWPILLIFLQLFNGGRGAQDANPLVLIGALVTSLVLTTLTYRFLETPIRDLGFRAYTAQLLAQLSTPRSRLVATGAFIAVGALLVVAVLRAPHMSALEERIIAGQALSAQSMAKPTPLSSPATDAPQIPTATDPTQDQIPPLEPQPISDAEVASWLGQGENITVIGDSVTAVATSDLLAQWPNVYVDAAVSRQLYMAKDIVTNQINDGGLRKVVVISLATNSTVSDSMINDLVETIGPGHLIVFINGYADRPWMGPTNAALAKAANDFTNVSVVDWSAAVVADPSILGSDQIHPTAKGAEVYASLLLSGLEQVAREQLQNQ